MKWLTLFLIFCLGLTSANQDDKQVVLNLHVVTADGDSFEKFPISVDVPSKTAFGITDKDGRTSISLTIDEEVSIIKLLPFGVNKAMTYVRGSEYREQMKIDKLRKIGKAWHIPHEIDIKIDPDAEQVDVEIKLIPAFSVSGRTVGPDGTPIRAIILGNALIPLTTSSKDGNFVLNGLEQSKEQYIYFRERSHIFRHHITQEESQAGCDIKDFIIKRDEPDELIEIVLERSSEFAKTAKMPISRITFIAVDGRYAVSTPQVTGELHNIVKLRIPHGSYYLVPGYFVREPSQTFVWDHAESPQKEWHGKHPLMRVEITEDEATHSLSVDLLELYTNLIEDMATIEEADSD